MVNEGRILSVQCDQSSEASLKEAIEIVGGKPFDLIVDDGSHIPDHQILTAKMLLPLLSPDGFYVIEDVYSTICVPAGYTSNIFRTGAGPDDVLVVIRPA
jgi:demethylmacrocin O-methyltransferase